MRFIKLYIFLSITCLLFTACENGTENLVQERGANVTPIVSGLKPAVFTTDASSYIKFYVSLPEGESVDNGYVEVGLDSTIAKVKDISSFPDSVTLKLSDIISALGISSDVETGTTFNIYVVTEKDGRTTRSYSGSFSASVVCAFDKALTVGSYLEESSGWDVSGNVTMTADASDPYTIYISGMQDVEGLSNGTSTPVTIKIDPDSYAVTGGSTVLAPDLSDWGYSYTNYTFTVASGTYDTCDGSYSIKFKISVDQGSFGTYSFVFTRN